MDSVSPPSSAVRASSARYSSTSWRSSSGLRIQLPLHGLDLHFQLLDGALELLELRDQVVVALGLLDLFRERLGALQPLIECHAASSRATRERIPFTSLAASSDAYRFASSTASLIATSTGTVSRSSSWMPTLRTFRSTTPSRSAL